MRIGDGALGGKAQGLLEGMSVLTSRFARDEHLRWDVEIPTTTVLPT